MQTATGRAFWPLDPRADEIDIEDIAHSLSNMCRYAGHCSEFYSVAQHSVLVSWLAPIKDALWGLLHDASEAYLVDVPRPVKPHLPGYREIEDRVMREVCAKFGLPEQMPASIKRLDRAILADEARDLMKSPPIDWGLTEPPLGIPIAPWTPSHARIAFLSQFKMLTQQLPMAGY